MQNITYYPLLVFIISFLALWLAALLGRFVLRGRHKPDKELREDFGTIRVLPQNLMNLAASLKSPGAPGTAGLPV